MANILVVDDDEAVREALAEVIRDLGHAPHLAASGHAALGLLGREKLAAAFLDLRMPEMDGLEVLRRLQARGAPPITVLTAHASAANTIEAMRLGAFDHLTKPIGRAELGRALERMLAVPRGEVKQAPASAPETLIGASLGMRAVQKTIGLLADSDATVLITGETGTGKELVARAIHDFGQRKAAAFVAVNCASIPSELLESELFGHVRGAFTGAIADRSGAFQQADGGTLLLDEIGDMDLAMQAKILRTLQERVITPVGGKPVRVDVRVIAATHRDLRERIRHKSFREDLYYRLHVVPIHLPSLRERAGDIVPLAEHFLAAAGLRKRLTSDAAARLLEYAWPGNVRELKNVMERAAVLVRGDSVGAADLSFLSESGAGPLNLTDWPDEDLPTALAHLEEFLIRRALKRSGGNRAEAARTLNIHRQLLYAKLKRYGLMAGDEEGPAME